MRLNPLKPEVQASDQCAERKPLKSIAFVFVCTLRHHGPVASQTVAVSASLNEHGIHIVVDQGLHLRHVQIGLYARRLYGVTRCGRGSQFDHVRQRRCYTPCHCHIARGRGHWRCFAGVTQIALHPATLHPNHLTRRPTQRCHDPKACLSVVVAVVQINGLRRQPLPLQNHGSMNLRPCLRLRQSHLSAEWRLIRLRFNMRLQAEFFIGT